MQISEHSTFGLQPDFPIVLAISIMCAQFMRLFSYRDKIIPCQFQRNVPADFTDLISGQAILLKFKNAGCLHVSSLFHTILPLTHLFIRQVADVSVLMRQSHLFYCILILKAQCLNKTISRQHNRRRLYTALALQIQVFYHSS